MAMMMGSLYEALQAVGVSKQVARQAAEEAAAFRLARDQPGRASGATRRLPEFPMWLLTALSWTAVGMTVALLILLITAAVHRYPLPP